jgi:ABC-type amino acid transport substrate-binding protein
MSKSNQISLGIVGVLILALLGGFLGAKFGGESASASENAQGAWIDGIKERGELRVGVAEAAPLTTMEKDDNGVAGGPMTLPMQHLAEELGVKYVAVPTTWANIVAGIQADRYDVAAYLDNTLERATAIQFSNPVLTYQGVFVVKASSQYSTSEDLIKSGSKLAIAQGTAYGDRLKARSKNVMELDTIPNALAAMKADRAEALFVDLPTAEGAVQNDDNLKIIVPDPVIYQSGSGYGVTNDIDPRSLQLINIAVLDAQDYGDLSIAFEKVGFREVEDLGDWLKK